LLDFSADLTIDEEEEERLGEEGRDTWTPPVVGHFREVGNLFTFYHSIYRQ
jgi:hypothetical protein